MLHRSLAPFALLVLAQCSPRVSAPMSWGPAPSPSAWSPAPATAAPALPSSDDPLAQQAVALRERLPPSFTVVTSPPFVVVGDEAPEVVRERAQSTVKWAVDRLKRDFFREEPKAALSIWLFKDRASYEHHASALFGDEPETPYGYYSPTHKALIMNISTGGGTLVHEIVHPFVEADFPGAPPWLNEGLGSLFEQSGERAGHIIGYTNWRLAGLQKAIRQGRAPSFKALTAADGPKFYGDDSGVNYAAARYLCYYMQEIGVLTRFYAEFRAARASDPTGYATLKKVLGERDMAAFEGRWRQFVLGLSFP